MRAIRRLICVVAGAIAGTLALAGCADGEGMVSAPEEMAMSRTQQEQVFDAWRVDMIVVSGREHDALTEYIYDTADRLTKVNSSSRSKGGLVVDTRSETRLEWENDLIVKQSEYYRRQDHNSGHDFENSFETAYEYNNAGRLVRQGREYVYDGLGRLVQTYRWEFEGMTYADRLEWDDNGNVVRRICPRPLRSELMEPIPGTYVEQVFEFEYDNHPKPNFGVGDAFFWDGRFNPWPGAGSADEQMIRTLSRNNLTRCDAMGLAYRYTYNANGLPETVQTIWIGVDTAEPMIQTLVYKRVAGDVPFGN
jgi:hypothetical protein